MKKLLYLLVIIAVLLVINQKFQIVPKTQQQLPSERRTLVYEESVITKVVDEALPSVVTVGIQKTTQTGDVFEVNPFDPFSPFRRIPGKKENIERNIGSGFIVTPDGFVITNRHVVADTQATYKVLTNDKKEYAVEKIYRDPLNDLAILKINGSALKALRLGDSSTLKLGQLAVAIGTPLGEFTNTVTVGIVSGLGRGITAGSAFEGYVEKLDNVIQTDAAINPGNSGGPLLNSKAEVIGVNTAIAQEGQNIGFAIPANIVRNLIENFQRRGGSFERPYIGIRYKMIDKQTALLNKVIEGAYVVAVLENSPAAKAGIREEDIITQFDGKQIKGDDNETLTKIILEKKVGDTVSITIWRDGKTQNLQLTLEAAK